MWKQMNDSYLQVRSEIGKIKVFFTDFIKIWFNQFSDADFLITLKESNFILVQIEDTELLEQGMRILNKPEVSNSSVKEDGTALKISMSIHTPYPFSLDLTLNEGSKELFFQMVTQPLLKSVFDLRSSEHDLIAELQKKDKEIEEYKAEGGRIALKHLKTKPFNTEVHTSSHRVYNDNFCISTIPQDLLDKKITLIDMKREDKDSESAISDSNIKIEQVEVDTKDTAVAIKQEAPTEIDRVIKTEPNTLSQTISPRKSQKRKLNL